MKAPPPVETWEILFVDINWLIAWSVDPPPATLYALLFSAIDLAIAEGPLSNWSYPTYPSHIDHIIITNELFNNHISTSTILIENALPDLSDYNNYISDHRPMGISLELLP